MKIVRINSNDCGGFRPPKGHLDTQMFPECEGTETDRNIGAKHRKDRDKHKQKNEHKDDKKPCCSSLVFNLKKYKES